MTDYITESLWQQVYQWRRELRGVGPVDVDILINSPGGALTECYVTARILGRYFDSWEALVPLQAASGATLVCLGSSRIIMSEVARLSPIDPQVMSKRAGKFFQVERQSPLEAFQAVRYLREYALTGLDATMHLLLNRMVTPQTALDTASRMATDLVQPILGKIDPYDLGALKLDSSLAIGYCQRVASPQDSRKRTQRDTDVRALVEKFPAHEFVIDAGEAAALGLNVCPPDETLANLFEELIPHLGEVKQYIGLLPGTEGSP